MVAKCVILKGGLTDGLAFGVFEVKSEPCQVLATHQRGDSEIRLIYQACLSFVSIFL